MSSSTPNDRRPAAAIGVDLDSAAVHLAGYGLAAPGVDRLLETALPRLFEALARRGCRATLFVVADDMPPRDLLDAAVAAGHELASHSATHPMPFARLATDALEREVAGSRRALMEATGVEVIGFRAPNWDLDRRVWGALASAGFRYDASLLPTPLQPLIRLLLAAGARSGRPLTAMPFLPPSTRRLPFRVRTPHGPIWEFPVPVSLVLRLPLYHTVRHRLPQATVDQAIRSAAQRGEAFGYAIHAIDLVALTDEGIDARLARHPGAGVPLDEKLALMDAALELIAGEFRVMPYRDVLRELEGASKEGIG